MMLQGTKEMTPSLVENESFERKPTTTLNINLVSD